MILMGGLAVVAARQRRSAPNSLAKKTPEPTFRRRPSDQAEPPTAARTEGLEQALPLNAREQRRTQVLEAHLSGELSRTEAADALNLSVRQLRRLILAYRQYGPLALVHANRGRTPWQAVPDDVRAQVIRLGQGSYAGLSQRQLAERLAAEHGIVLHRTTVRRILLEAKQGGKAIRAPIARTPQAPPIRHYCLGRGLVPGCHCV